MQQRIHTISFVGLGLIGASLMQALKRAATATGRTIELIGFDPGFSDEDKKAITSFYGLNRFEEEPSRLYDADLVVLCAPALANIGLLDTVKKYAPEDALITDVSSTKADIDERAKELEINFLGMHPIAGKETQGFREASPELLKDRTVIICSGDKLPESGHAAELVELLRAASCNVVAMSPEEHDRIYAYISHLTQLVSTALMQYCGDFVNYSGPGFATITRLAGSLWPMWYDIVKTNRENIAKDLKGFADQLSKMADDVSNENYEALESKFREANDLYQRLQERSRS